ncbi:conserved hypothetical protein [Gloeothece citriformis PCC 7424]|uniref:Uncharacterized protein n=1 Tax=Gloeothece citriformis (strain PCC 7424) TaxID=65393 RepID=B7KDZ6_GLOC7|nr:hypothetical protein [Gloeothece citriformis]ACK71694.1 conserved hypothetical protein [Gloeothece citriformis PCC 7424]
MTRFFHDDDDDQVVQFLSQYRPLPPTPSPQLEQELMQRIEQEPIESKYSSRWVWIVSSAIVGLSLMIWGSDRWLKPFPQIANGSQDLEAFLVHTWTQTVEDTDTPSRSYPSETQNSNLYWLSLVDSQGETYSSNR